ncbi:phage tail protein [Marinomonas mediterranea]|uniref:phage tail protein n=1 Tax=Marinomonas mediterranea TaxID=119864 RepID=UPI00234A76E9|nr:tail fiber protein [Marinomonas mediterranea]WCN08583.1 phage tail protein [Marinomonas mediterranea]WCN12637.1 phage tail protein [Marinomonas mediterranea]
MADPFIGEIRAFAFSFAPRGWSQCDGQVMSIAQNPALFSIIGTTYGGDGRTTLGIPNLKDRTILHGGFSTGPGLSPHILGQFGGQNSVTLTDSELPAHTHTISGYQPPGYEDTPSPSLVVAQQAVALEFINDTSKRGSMGTMSNQALKYYGANSDHENRQPAITVNYCICWDGAYPSRN